MLDWLKSWTPMVSGWPKSWAPMVIDWPKSWADWPTSWAPRLAALVTLAREVGAAQHGHPVAVVDEHNC